jgi:DNA-binding SARP family transcriptional activator
VEAAAPPRRTAGASEPARPPTVGLPSADLRAVEDDEAVDVDLEVTVGAPDDALPTTATTATIGEVQPQRNAAVAPLSPVVAKAVGVQMRVTVFGPLRVYWRHDTAPPQPAAGPDLSTPADVTGDVMAEMARALDGMGETRAVEEEVTAVFQPRTRELLTFLAIHPDGVSRDSLGAALWPDSPPDRLTNALNTALSRLRRAVRAATANTITDIVLSGQGRYRLDPVTVDLDYTRFLQAHTDRRTATTPEQRQTALRAMIDTYAGPLADGMAMDWLEPVREAMRRDAIDAVGALARALVATEPEQTLELLEIARAFDPFNELLYRDIMRLQARLGRPDAIPRTLALLTTRLGELDDQPSAQTIALAQRLCNEREPADAGLRPRLRPVDRAG